jgi:uncharacterized Zn finger protein (UPF0148 family)
MTCKKCGKESTLFTADGEVICEDCAKKLDYTICLESGKYKDFQCDNICSDCIFKNEER